MSTIYIAQDPDDGIILGVFITLDLLHRSHKFSNHKRLDQIERWEQDKYKSTAYLKDGKTETVNVVLHPIYDSVEHL